MRQNGFNRSVVTAILVLSTAMFGTSCNGTSGGGKTATASSDGGKIPITTKSEDARKEFQQGRDLSEKLLAQDSLQHFDKAIAADPEFASAELARANASPSAKEFFEHLKRAVSLGDKASEGERLLILANEAGANGDAVKQKEYLDKLVAAYPNDERAHFNLGGYYFGQQDYDQAIEHYKKATELAPNYSPAYNIIGYAYRQQGNYGKAEEAFKKYIELIPNDPNPYDSYAEMLLKMGRFDESITQYRKALSVDSKFFPSHLGIAANLTYMGKPEAATTELQKITDTARSDGERRAALFAMTVVEVDGGQMNKALKEMDKQYALGEKAKDAAAMAGDLQAKGNILVEMQKYDEAKKQFALSLQLTQGSTLSQEIKDNAKLLHHYNLSRVAVGKKDYRAAKIEAEEFRKGADASRNPAQVKQAHELTGIIALAEKDYGKAIAELQQANLQDPGNLYRLCQANEGTADTAKAHDYCTKAARFNSLPQLNYAFIRMKAQKMAGGSERNG
jgi:tetratricopeptide (TPR) repeat protein